MTKNRIITVINILLALAMVIHVGVKMYLHTRHPEYSAPAYVELVNAVYYLIPLAVINLGAWIWKKS